MENYNISDLKVLFFSNNMIRATRICNMKKIEDLLQNEFGTLSQKTGLNTSLCIMLN